MRKKFFAILICLLLVYTLAFAGKKTEDSHINKRNDKIETIEKNEKYPFFPSLINTIDGQPITPDSFEEPIICSGCHTEIYQQWKGSMHSNAFVDPVFTALWKLGAK